MQKIKILGFPVAGLLTSQLFMNASFQNKGLSFTMQECIDLLEQKRVTFYASLGNMVINRTADTITVFEDGKNETISMQWCEVSELGGLNEAHAADVLQSTETNVIHTAEYMHGIVKKCISVMQSYLPPDGISKDDAINDILGILDNAEIVKELKDAEELFS